MLRWLQRHLFGDPDATVKIGRPRRVMSRRPRQRVAKWPIAVAAVAGIAVCGAVAWMVWPAPPVSAPAADLPHADEAQILAAYAAQTTLYRFAQAPLIVVAVFPSLHVQAETLNRIGVFLEYSRAPRDRVLNDAQLHAAIAAGGLSFDEFYDGHDYRAADLARFFATADADGVALDDAEQKLRASLDELRQTPAGFGALISLPQAGADRLDVSARAAILRHELSHGLYFTDPGYAEMVTAWWQTFLTDQERAGFRRFLGAGHYDTANEDLMRNEAQAYLIHTRNPRYFSPAAAGLSDAQAASLRAQFFAAMPAGWLRDGTTP